MHMHTVHTDMYTHKFMCEKRPIYLCVCVNVYLMYIFCSCYLMIFLQCL
uniref:Uncharacterized protein n=1 Tax=Anguilla anguilla TaxID=7936 RepID=A0A0E9XK81_ANGAN